MRPSFRLEPLPSVRPPHRGGRSHLLALSLCLSMPLVVGIFAPTPARADERVDARRHFQNGMSLIEGGRYLEGIEQLKKAYALLPHPSVLYNIGRACLDAGLYQDAVEYLERYIRNTPEDREEAQRLLSRARLRRAAQSAREYRQQEQQNPQDPSDPPPSGGLPLTGGAGGLDEVEADLLRALARVRAVRRGEPASVGEADSADSSSARSGEPTGRNAAPDAGQSGSTPQAAGAGGGSAGDETSSRPSDIAGPPAADPYAQEVITSSRYAQDLFEAPSTITVLTREDLERSGVHSLPDLLRRVPGLEVMAISPSDHNIGIRGFNGPLANKVLVLVDGRSVYQDFVGATLWSLLSISLSDVERIEVIRGPGAALFGANAFSGVINIITRAPGSSSDGPQLSVQQGLPDYHVSSVHLTGRQGGTAFRASLGAEGLERWSQELASDREDYLEPARFPEYAARVGRFDLRVDQRIDQTTSLSLSGGMAFGQSEFSAIGALREFFVDGSAAYLRGDLVLPGGFSVRTFWNHFDVLASPWLIPTGGLDIRSNPLTDVVDVEVERYQEIRGPIRQRLNVGAGYRFKQVSWEWMPELAREHHLSLFAQDELHFGQSFTSVLSLRLDRHPLLADQQDAPFLDRYAFSPRAALLWQVLPGHVVRGALGTAFRTPTFLESYLEQEIPTSTDALVVQTLGNQALLPERIFSLEVGYRNHPKDNRRELELVAFMNGINRLMEFGDLIPWTDEATQYNAEEGYWYAGTTQHENVDAVHLAQGVEASARFFPAEGFDVYANYAFTYIQRGMATGAPTVDSTSRHKVNAGLRYANPRLSLSVDFSASSPQTWRLRSFGESGEVVYQDITLPASTWVSSRLGYRFRQQGLEVAIEGNNLLAVLQPAVAAGEQSVETPAGTHREYPLGQAIPPSVGASLTWRFW